MKNILKLNKKSKKNSKAVVGNAKKQLTRNKWKLTYLSLVALILFSSVGYTMYGYWKSKSLKAHASAGTYLGSTTIVNNIRLTSYGCKQSVSSIYGPLWKIHVTTFASSSVPWDWGVGIQVWRNGKLVNNNYNNGWLFGVINGVDAFASQLTPDKFDVSIGTTNRGGFLVQGRYPSTLANC